MLSSPVALVTVKFHLPVCSTRLYHEFRPGSYNGVMCELEVCRPGTYLPSPRVAGTVCLPCPSGTFTCLSICCCSTSEWSVPVLGESFIWIFCGSRQSHLGQARCLRSAHKARAARHAQQIRELLLVPTRASLVHPGTSMMDPP